MNRMKTQSETERERESDGDREETEVERKTACRFYPITPACWSCPDIIETRIGSLLWPSSHVSDWSQAAQGWVVVGDRLGSAAGLHRLTW